MNFLFLKYSIWYLNYLFVICYLCISTDDVDGFRVGLTGRAEELLLRQSGGQRADAGNDADQNNNDQEFHFVGNLEEKKETLFFFNLMHFLV